MKRVWLILNRGSRAVGDGWEASLAQAFEARGATIIGTTDFPDEDLPDAAALDGAQADLVAVAAGDGTINATARALDDWSGALLILPGGTMNLLAKALHGDATPEAIIAAISDPPQAAPLPTIDCGETRALVGAIIGPGARWVHVREAVRKGRWGRLRHVIRLAYVRSLSRAVHLRSGGRRSRGYRAVFIHTSDDALSVVKVRARGWADGARLGFSYLAGVWENARGIETATVDALTLAEDQPVFALFDGEPAYLSPDARFTPGRTRLRFVRTA